MILMEVCYRFKLVVRRPYRLTQKLSNGQALISAEHSHSLSTTRQSGFYNIDLASSRRFLRSSKKFKDWDQALKHLNECIEHKR